MTRGPGLKVLSIQKFEPKPFGSCPLPTTKKHIYKYTISCDEIPILYNKDRIR